MLAEAELRQAQLEDKAEATAPEWPGDDEVAVVGEEKLAAG
jgi:hypothetical protein